MVLVISGIPTNFYHGGLHQEFFFGVGGLHQELFSGEVEVQ
jgi:hypothetical protein